MAIHLTEQARQDVTIGKGTIYLDSDTGELNVAGRTTPHIIPGVLYPAVAGNDINGTDIDTSHGSTYTYGELHTDGRKYYYTDIKGSKPIKDPRIGGHFGSQRHKFKSLQLLEQETATHGDEVYSVDGRDWIRRVGKFDVHDGYGTQGHFLGHTATGDATNSKYFEIVGYFNAANYLSYVSSDRDVNVFIDGTQNPSSTFTGGTGVNTPLANRYVDSSSVINIPITGLTTPGIHTLKIANVSGDYLLLFGIELIAQDTSNRNNIQIPSQNVVSYGKKFTVSAEGSSGHHYNPFNGYTATSSFSSVVDVDTSLGLEAWKHTDNNYYPPVNGGRIVKWVDSSGVIKTSVTLMPPNATGIGSFSSNPRDPNYGSWSSQYQPTFKNETERQLHEVAKTFHWREFGNGSANGNASYADASTLATATNDIAYVMDDGLTSLSADDAGDTVTLTDFSLAGNGDFSYLTFIGTGISITGNNSGLLNDTKHIAQNLPYGTHIFKNTRGSSATGGDYIIDGVDTTVGFGWGGFREVTFYQPKRPPIPEDACVIADYMLMADFVPQTAGTLGHISKGIRSVSGSRDVFVDRVGSVAFSLVMDVAAGPRALRVGTSALGVGDTATIKLPYFGTDFLIQHYNNRKGTITENLNSDVGTYANISTSAYEGLSKHTGNNLGLNELKNHITDGQNDDELWTSHVQIATPIHTSSHYQTFETPFLHELVGGDRNMEQTNLVCSPDGKTWDEVTRDTSYIGNGVLNLNGIDGDPSDSDRDHETLGAQLVFLDCRGNYQGEANHYNKDFAIGYDRYICLKDGQYRVAVFTIASANNQGGDHGVIRLNSQLVARGHTGTSGYGNVYCSWEGQINRGDYISIHGRWHSSDSYSGFTITRI